MKKSIIALAVAGALTAPMVAQADATLYGSLRFDIDDTDTADTDTSSNMARIRFGIKGSEETNAGQTAGYNIRFDGLDSSNNSAVVDRANVYLQGDFGRITGGIQTDPAEIASDRVEYSLHSGSVTLLDPSDYTSGGLVYNTNTINGFKVFIGLGNVDTDSAATEYSFTTTYDSDFLSAAVSITEASAVAAASAVAFAGGTGTTATVPYSAAVVGTDSGTTYALSASVNVAGGTIGVSYADRADTSLTAVSNGADGYSIGGSYPMGDFTLAADFESATNDAAGSKAMNATMASVHYSLGGNATVSLGVRSSNSALEADGTADQVTARYQVDF